MDTCNRRGFLKAGSLLAGSLMLGDSLFAKKSSFFGYEPFMGEIMMVAFDFAPRGWTKCNGQLLPINTNQALFSLLGSTYGGNGQTTFALPDFKGRVPIHPEDGLSRGANGGAASHLLSANEMPMHSHSLVPGSNVGLKAANIADIDNSNKLQFGMNPNAEQRFHSTYDDKMGDANFTTGITGESQPHSNMMPYLTLNFVIALQGVYPSRD